MTTIQARRFRASGWRRHCPAALQHRLLEKVCLHSVICYLSTPNKHQKSEAYLHKELKVQTNWQEHRGASMARVPHRDLPAYQELEGRPYPINAPVFSADHPNLSVGQITLRDTVADAMSRILAWKFLNIKLQAAA